MNGSLGAALFLGVLIVGGSRNATAQEIPIGIIDFYGLGSISEAEARTALTFREGTVLRLGDRPAFIDDSRRQLLAMPGVAAANLNIVCCDDGRAMVYVGIEERGQSTMRFRDAPTGPMRLAADVVEAGADLEKALVAAVLRGEAAEDDSQGHSLATADSELRAIEERLIVFANRDAMTLRSVLRNSSDADQRALAAQVLGYVANKQTIISDLVYGMSDPVEGVRNNAMRSLAVIARMIPSIGHPKAAVPCEPFIELLRSPAWTDRNKASFALMQLTETRDPQVLKLLNDRALTELIDMAHWKNAGHAMPALLILGRMAGMSDSTIQSALSGNERESIVRAALKR